MKNKILVFLSTFFLISLFSLSFAEIIPTEVTLNKGIRIMYNGDYQKFKNANGVEVYPISYNGTTYLPIRSISSLFKMRIRWDGTTQSIYLGEGDVDTVASEKVAAASSLTAEKINANINKDIKIFFNNQGQSFTDANGVAVFPISYNGTTYLPVRAISNLFGAEISWDGANNTVALKSKIVQEPAGISREFSMGNWNGNVYTNGYLGLQFTMPTGWVVVDNEQWNQAYNAGTDILGEEGYNKEVLQALKDQNVVMFTSVTNNKTGSSVQFVKEKNVYQVTEQQYLDSVKSQLEGISTIHYSDITTSNETLAGQSYYVLRANAEYLGIHMKQYYFLRKLDDSLFYIVVTDTSDNINLNSLIKAY